MVGIRQESLYLFVKVNVRPVAIEFRMGRVKADVQLSRDDESADFIGIHEGICDPLPTEVPGMRRQIFKKDLHPFGINLLDRATQVLVQGPIIVNGLVERHSSGMNDHLGLAFEVLCHITCQVDGFLD